MAIRRPLTPRQTGLIAGVAVLVLTIAGCAYLYFMYLPAPKVLPLASLPQFPTGVVSELGQNGVFFRTKPFMSKRNQLAPRPTLTQDDIGKTDLIQASP